MHPSKAWKILQIIPAQVGWKAVHCQASGNKPIQIFNRPVICWALVEALGEGGVAGTEVRGVEKQEDHLAVVEDLINGGENGDDGIDRSQYFLGYDDPATHKESEYWIQQANDRCKRERATNDLPGLVQVSQRVIEE
jgi:hypothetical protein